MSALRSVGFLDVLVEAYSFAARTPAESFRRAPVSEAA
jgi:hypothetical protein